MKKKQHAKKSVVWRMPVALVLILVLLSIALFDGCNSRKTEDTAACKHMLLYCGAGIRPPIAELIKVYCNEHKDVKIQADYAGSEVLLSKIKLTHTGDLYMPGDKHYVQQAADAGMTGYSRDVCYFVPVIMVQKGNPKNIKTLRDLLKPGIKVGLGDPRSCAIGRKTRKILAKNNIPFSAIEHNVKFQSQTVNELGLQIYSGSLDAVIVWGAIARYYKDSAVEITIPPSQNIISTVRAGVLKFSKYKTQARDFIDFMASPKGQKIFSKYHYTVENPG